MDWLFENIPILSGVAVAALSFLSSLVKLIGERNGGARRIKRLKTYSEMYSVMPSNSIARENLEALMDKETSFILERVNRKLNIANLIAVIILASVGGTISYLLALWATNTNSIILSILAWVLFTIGAFFTIGISVVGLKSMYDDPKKKDVK